MASLGGIGGIGGKLEVILRFLRFLRVRLSVFVVVDSEGMAH